MPLFFQGVFQIFFLIFLIYFQALYNFLMYYANEVVLENISYLYHLKSFDALFNRYNYHITITKWNLKMFIGLQFCSEIMLNMYAELIKRSHFRLILEQSMFPIEAIWMYFFNLLLIYPSINLSRRIHIS